MIESIGWALLGAVVAIAGRGLIMAMLPTVRDEVDLAHDQWQRDYLRRTAEYIQMGFHKYNAEQMATTDMNREARREKEARDQAMKEALK